jgi:serine/threonine-protein kinase
MQRLSAGGQSPEQAIKIDPTFAEAYAADCAILTGRTGLMPSARPDKARYVAAKALELDGSLSEAHTARAVILQIYDEDWTGAEEEFRQAIKLNPGNREAHREYGMFLSRRGRTEEGLAEAIRAFDLDPLSGTVNGTLIWSYVVNRQYDKAIEHSLMVLQLNPDFTLVQFNLGQAYLMKGLYEEAIAVFESDAMVKFDNLDVLVYCACAYALSGKRDKALNLLNEFQRRPAPGMGSAPHIAKIYVCLGEKDKALDILEQEQSFSSTDIIINPIFDPLRAEPRYQALLKKIELEK